MRRYNSYLISQTHVFLQINNSSLISNNKFVNLFIDGQQIGILDQYKVLRIHKQNSMGFVSVSADQHLFV